MHIITFIRSFFWGFVLLGAFAGWGYFTSRFLFSKKDVPAPVKVVLGIALTMFTGGLLNIFAAVSVSSILAYTALGNIILFAFLIFERRDVAAPGDINGRFGLSAFNIPVRTFIVLGASLILIILLFRYTSSIVSVPFNIHDDYHAYLVFPKKMLEAGSIGVDPFSERRMTASLGGYYFIQTFVLAFLKIKNIKMIDAGIGFLLSFWFVFYLLKRDKINIFFSLLVLLCFSLEHGQKINITAQWLPIAFYAAIYIVFRDELLMKNNHFVRNALAVGLLGSGICGLKSNNIPGFVIIVSFLYFFEFFEKRKIKIVFEYILGFLFTGLFLLPWMILMQRSSGTYLYPFLGKGFHISKTFPAVSPWTGLNASKIFSLIGSYLLSPYVLTIGLLSLAVLFIKKKNIIKYKTEFAMIIAAFIAGQILDIATGGEQERFFFSFIYAAYMSFLIFAFSVAKEYEGKGIGKRIFTIFIILCALFPVAANARSNYYHVFRLGKSGVKYALLDKDIYIPERKGSYKSLQVSVPEGETILTRLSTPFLLDFRRNQIFVADYPGMVSPPPGMPLYQGAPALALYLYRQGIRYVAYSYKNQALFRENVFGPRRKNIPDKWGALEMFFTLYFQSTLMEIAKNRKIIYDDGENFVIDLKLPND